MALENVMRVDGGHIVTGGGAGGNSVEIDWKDWCELTPEEQETGDWTIINCPWADGDVSVDLMTKLWENPDPTQNFAAQNITLSSGDYDFLLGMCNITKTATLMISCMAKKGSGLSFTRTDTSNNISNIWRNISYVDDTHLSVADCMNNAATDNTKVIPVVIYGIKLTVSVKINAIAMDVSTSADKCMLSENESVKDRIDSVYAIETVTITSYNTLANAYTCPTDGYVRISNGNIGLLTKDSTNYWTILQNSGDTKLAGIFVKKGSKIVVFNSSIGISPGNAVFVKMST